MSEGFDLTGHEVGTPEPGEHLVDFTFMPDADADGIPWMALEQRDPPDPSSPALTLVRIDDTSVELRHDGTVWRDDGSGPRRVRWFPSRLLRRTAVEVARSMHDSGWGLG